MAQRRSIERAYVAAVTYDASTYWEDAVRLRGQGEPALVNAIGREFSSSVGKDGRFNVLFLNDELEADLERVCRPFYQAV